VEGRTAGALLHQPAAGLYYGAGLGDWNVVRERPARPGDFVETDGGVHNIRVMRNRGVNAAHGGLSAQPVFGGPAYFIRNVLYQVPSGIAFTFSAKPAGLLVYHNTVIAEHAVRDPHANTDFRNNLFLGTDTPGRGIATFANASAYSTYDFDGFQPGKSAGYAWLAPASASERLYTPQPADWKSFRSLGELRAATNHEVHGMEVDYDVFERLTPPRSGDRHAIYHAMDLSFALRPGSAPVDAGVGLPTINDDFTGRAPDLGALEQGRPMPHYRPRRAAEQPFYR
jgi:hypothetical protein